MLRQRSKLAAPDQLEHVMMRVRAVGTTLALGVAVLVLAACSGGSATATQSPSGPANSAAIATTAASGGAVVTAGAPVVAGSSAAVGESADAMSTVGAAAGTGSGGIAITCPALASALPDARIAAAVGGTLSPGDPESGGCEWFVTGSKLDGILKISSTTAASKSDWLEVQTGDPDPTAPEVKLPDIGGDTAYWAPTGAVTGGQITLWDGAKEIDLGIELDSAPTDPAVMAADQASMTTLATDLVKS